MTAKKKIRHKLFALLVSTCFGLCITEAALRVIGYTYPMFYTADIERGYALAPGAQGWYRKENQVYVRISSQGLRDREHTIQKPEAVVRIAIIGDSFAEALQVPFEKSFPAVIERRLATCGAFAPGRAEVINFGVSGYGTAQELITLQKHVWQFSPDIVVLAVTTNNDISDNLRELKKTDEVPYFALRGDRLEPDNSFRTTRAFRMRTSGLYRAGLWIRNHVRVLQLIHNAHYALKGFLARQRAAAPANALSAENKRTGFEIGIDSQIYREPVEAQWNQAWAVTEALIREMRNEVRARGVRFLVVTLSNAIQVHPSAKAREDFLARIGANDIFYPDNRIRLFCEREGIPVLMLAQGLQRYAEQRRVFIHGFGSDTGNGHWNEEGHRLGGEMIAAAICDRRPQ